MKYSTNAIIIYVLYHLYDGENPNKLYWKLVCDKNNLLEMLFCILKYIFDWITSPIPGIKLIEKVYQNSF